jgi:VWFA-related protein
MKKLAVVLALVAALSSIVAAQVLRVDVSLVNVVATVTDERGRYVSGLKAQDFILEEDGKRQEIVHFAPSQDLAVSVGIVVDTSASMERKINTAVRAVDRFIRDIHPTDEIFYMTFDDRPRVRQDFTSDREKLAEALYRTKLGSGTALYDGLIAGLDKVKKGKHTKKAILLLSDGYDTSSDHDFEVALQVTRESEVLVYCLGISPDTTRRDPLSERAPLPGRTPPVVNPFPVPLPIPIPGGGTFPSPLPGPGRRAVEPLYAFPQGRTMPNMDAIDMTILDAFAEASGGNSWLISTGEGRTEQIRDALELIANELRNQYTIGYYPGHSLNDGLWHRIDIQTKDPEYHVRAKKDYFGK